MALMGKQKRNREDQSSALLYLPLYCDCFSVRTRVHHVICLESACLVCYSLFMWSTSSVGNENGESELKGKDKGREEYTRRRRRFSVDERDVTAAPRYSLS